MNQHCRFLVSLNDDVLGLVLFKDDKPCKAQVHPTIKREEAINAIFMKSSIYRLTNDILSADNMNGLDRVSKAFCIQAGLTIRWNKLD